MAIEVSELITLRDTLIRARAKGILALQLNGERIQYRTDAEMASAIADLEARIRRASARPANAVRFSTSKGM
ncbi:phage head-tail joining protein [Paenirhodobacter sp.]|uniref:phage head-tail joining protein n=1 Tax=Paenirhodobacter sp. TaxID=1965326 RepID=UPI003B501C75